MRSHDSWRPLSVAPDSQLAPAQGEVYEMCRSPGRWVARMVMGESGWRDESSRAVVRPITPAPRMMKEGGGGMVNGLECDGYEI